MTQSTADSTAEAESWLQSHRDLHRLVDDVLRMPDMHRVLAEARIGPAEARARIVEDPTILARIRLAGDSTEAFGVARRRRRLARAGPKGRIVVAVVVVAGYLSLLDLSWTAMPWGMRLFGLVGLVATGGWALSLAAGDAESMMTSAPSDARTSRRRQAMSSAVRRELRLFVDERRTPSFSTTLTVEGMQNVYADDNEAPVVITAAGQRLRRIMERPTSGAVALAGRRGVGKTTALRAVARGMFGDLGTKQLLVVLASAPSRYEARDFVLHLHALLAKQVIGLTSGLLGEPPPSSWLAAGRGVRHLVPYLVVLGLFGAAAVLAVRLDPPDPRLGNELGHWFALSFADFPRHLFASITSTASPGLAEAPFSPRVLVALAVITLAAEVLAVVVVLVRWVVRELRRQRFARENGDVVRLRDAAHRQLDRIRFMQTYTSGWSGKIGFPSGDATWSRTTQRAEQNLTHPEVVAEFRRFAGRAVHVLARQGAIERMVVAIDELDKIADPAAAHEFVNDVKGIFGVPGCLFLVAVSEDALTAFERRGIPVRDALDSAFTEMVRMDAFNLTESRRWLGRRLLAVPEPFSHLCHCLSGGLPRDLRRTTIDMIDVVLETGATDLALVTRAMVDRELDRKANAFAAAARQLDDSPELSAHVADLLTIMRTITADDLTLLAADLAPGPDSAIPGLRWQSACFVLFCATVLDVFTDDLTPHGLTPVVELLGTARAQLSVDPHVAWQIVQDARHRFGLRAVGRTA